MSEELERKVAFLTNHGIDLTERIVKLKTEVHRLHAVDEAKDQALEMLVNELSSYKIIVKAILEADERGQGTPFAEAMEAARKLVAK